MASQREKDIIFDGESTREEDDLEQGEAHRLLPLKGEEDEEGVDDVDVDLALTAKRRNANWLRRLKSQPWRFWLALASAIVSAILLAFSLLHLVPLVFGFGGSEFDALSPLDDPAQYVDPLIGTLTGGHVFAGATLPFGSIKPVYDTAGGDDQGGFVSDGSAVYGLSQTHDDGTGGASSLGNFQVLPQYCVYGVASNADSGCKLRHEDRAVARVNGSEDAEPGFFGIELASGIGSQTTVTAHTAIHRFNFTRAITAAKVEEEVDVGAPNRSATLLLDLTRDLPVTYRGTGELHINFSSSSNGTANSSVPWHTPRISGWGSFSPSFGTGYYKLYFCADVPGVRTSKTFIGDQLFDIQDQQFVQLRHPTGWSGGAGAIVEIDDQYLEDHDGVLPMRIAISWTSISNACRFLEDEIPVYETLEAFDSIRNGARRQWNDALSASFTPDFTGVNRTQKVMFYSSLYRTMINPNNITGDMPLWNTTEPSYDSFYCIWDTMRANHPLYSLLHPEAGAQMIRSLIDIYRHEGYLPDCRMSLCKGLSQGGSNADTVLADGFIKMGKDYGNVNWTDGLAAMRKDAEVSPPDWGVEGRGGIEARKKLGYVPIDGDGNRPYGARVVRGRSASRTLEYGYNDFGIALVAGGLNDSATYNDYLNKSLDWRNLWDDSVESDGYRGFVQARHTAGHFSHAEDPRKCSPAFEFGRCYLMYIMDDAQFYEASAWQYSFSAAPHDMAQMVSLMGGPETFINRLDHLWDERYGDIGDEPGFLPSFLYHYAPNGYHKSVDRAMTTLNTYFSTESDGIPGNDDAGSMGAYVVFVSMGFYPVSGTGVYLLLTPLMPGYTIKNAITYNTARIRTVNWDGAYENKYIISAKLNGANYTRNWISHSFFLEGGELELTMGSEPSGWGEGSDDLPPSITAGGYSYERAALGY